jgi:hypothetical protein
VALDDLLTGYGHHKFEKPKIAGSYKGKSLVVCADAACIWGDLEAFGCASYAGRGKVAKDGWDFMTINKIVETFPGEIEHCYSNEPQILHRFIAARRQEYAKEFGAPRNTHSCNEGAKWRWPWGGQGTSLLGGVLVGLGLGYDRVVICGGPLDDGPHNGEPHWRACRFKSREACGSVDDDRDAHWKRAIDLAFEGRVKSMSGRTGEWLGRP